MPSTQTLMLLMLYPVNEWLPCVTCCQNQGSRAPNFSNSCFNLAKIESLNFGNSQLSRVLAKIKSLNFGSSQLLTVLAKVGSSWFWWLSISLKSWVAHQNHKLSLFCNTVLPELRHLLFDQKASKKSEFLIFCEVSLQLHNTSQETKRSPMKQAL